MRRALPAGNDRERVARFLERHAVSETEAVEADVAPYRGMSLEETWRDIEAVARDAAFLLAAQPDRDQIVQQQDPPHPTYRGILARLIAQRRRET